MMIFQKKMFQAVKSQDVPGTAPQFSLSSQMMMPMLRSKTEQQESPSISLLFQDDPVFQNVLPA
jgi:hypothetical protein